MKALASERQGSCVQITAGPLFQFQKRRKMEFKKFLIFILIVFALFISTIALVFVITGSLKSFFNSIKPGITGRGVEGHVSIFILPRCNFGLGNGWNFFSLCADPDNKTIDAVIGNTSYRYVMRWNTTRMEWDIYSPRATENPFDSFTTNESYFTLLYSPYTMYIAGPENPDMNITMLQGWNAPSWPYVLNTNITKYFNETLHRYMMKWDNNAQEFLIYSPRSVNNPFSMIYTAEGQMLYAYSNHTLRYNKTELQG